jgi:hypothetical protein
LTLIGAGFRGAERGRKYISLSQKKYCNPICLCYIARHTLALDYPRIRINSEGKE